jgi:hypothetical protein
VLGSVASPSTVVQVLTLFPAEPRPGFYVTWRLCVVGVRSMIVMRSCTRCIAVLAFCIRCILSLCCCLYLWNIPIRLSIYKEEDKINIPLLNYTKYDKLYKFLTGKAIYWRKRDGTGSYQERWGSVSRPPSGSSCSPVQIVSNLSNPAHGHQCGDDPGSDPPAFHLLRVLIRCKE